MTKSSPLALYIHWPYCLSKCPYCDFNSHVRPTIDEDSWVKALLSEISTYQQEFPNKSIRSIFWGGGTPSLITPSTVNKILSHITSTWPLEPHAEITLEANPNSIEAEKFANFKTAGINRVSVGVQALNDADLKYLGRKHTALEAKRALDIAFSTFDRVNFDLIYARTDQSAAAWEAELNEALQFDPTHLSLYQLTLEPGTVFTQRAARGDLILPDDDRAADLYELTQDIMNTRGLPAYEISNHAKPDFECQHNLVYWRYGDFLGLGPGAHGRIDGRAINNIKPPEHWQEAVGIYGKGVKEEITLTEYEKFSEFLLMGLRLSEGVSLQNTPTFLNLPAFNELKSAGFLAGTPAQFRATQKGRLILNQLVERLILPE